MTTDELRNWHARLDRWEVVTGGWRRERQDSTEYEYRWAHPFPPTLDAADASFPPGWDWSREYRGGSVVWFASSMAEHPNTKRCHTIGTNSKIHDLYALAKLAWEQEQSNDGN